MHLLPKQVCHQDYKLAAVKQSFILPSEMLSLLSTSHQISRYQISCSHYIVQANLLLKIFKTILYWHASCPSQ